MGDRWLTIDLEPEQPARPDPEQQTDDRWLTVVLEPEPEQPVLPRQLAPETERRPVRVALPEPPPRRRPLWSLAAGVMLISGVLAGLLGASLVAASGAGWNDSVRQAAQIREDLADRWQAATAALTNELTELEPTDSILAEVSTALETAARLAADLEALASGGPSGPDEAMQEGGEALLVVSDVAVPVPVTGFGPFVLRYPLPGHSVTDSFGTRRGDKFHQGIDIGAPAWTPILAAADGVVLQAGRLADGAGNGVILRHDQGWETRYFHMVSADLPVATGDSVLAGQVIGNVGSTGDSTGPHLHFEVVYGPIKMDPEAGFTYIGREFGIGGPTIDPIDPPLTEPPASDPPPIDLAGARSAASAAERSASDIAALSDAAADIADVQRELLDIAADASVQAALLEERRIAEQDRARTAALILFGGAVAVVLGLLLMWVTRPRWPATR
jgi:murein DD-endopeptidase MepM/ murein hydrolase activator NlpD